MTTFSQLIDEMVAELRRPDMRDMMCSYLNQSVRELHSRPNANSPINYDANRYEDEFAVNVASPYLWTLPAPSRFQGVEAIYVKEFGLYVEQRNPRLIRKDTFEPYPNLFWYRSGPQIAISGVNDGNTLQVSYFMYVPSLAYQLPNARLVVYDPATDSYKTPAGGTPTEADMEASTHWMLERWSETLKEGIRAKVWKRNGDMDRTRTAFSAYESARATLWNSEPSS